MYDPGYLQTSHTDRTPDQPTRFSELYAVVGLKRLSPGRLRLISTYCLGGYVREISIVLAAYVYKGGAGWITPPRHKRMRKAYAFKGRRGMG